MALRDRTRKVERSSNTCRPQDSRNSLRSWGSRVRIAPGSPFFLGSIPDTWITDYSGDIVDTFSGTNGFGPGYDPSLVFIKESKVKVKEADQPDLVIDLADSNDLASKDPAEVDLSSAHADPAAMRHTNGSVVVRVIGLGWRCVDATRRCIEISRISTAQSLMRPLLIANRDELIEALLLLRKLNEAGLIASFFSVRCMRSWRPFCWGQPGLMRWILMPSLSHQTASLESPNRALPEAKGVP
jgi:hypothetical protein